MAAKALLRPQGDGGDTYLVCPEQFCSNTAERKLLLVSVPLWRERLAIDVLHCNRCNQIYEEPPRSEPEDPDGA